MIDLHSWGAPKGKTVAIVRYPWRRVTSGILRDLALLSQVPRWLAEVGAHLSHHTRQPAGCLFVAAAGAWQPVEA
ncbi:hypothetical protein [Vogesella indigofera]|uniref:hypothetical protein n=1 Tax=Vogesella indigofera TaxID=45465 RepID=UPI00234E9FC1|nr:hypothetical protein [Vogesella indigofera]MDC7698982.1 hypothetical protein [Vogesella indigofera]